MPPSTTGGDLVAQHWETEKKTREGERASHDAWGRSDGKEGQWEDAPSPAQNISGFLVFLKLDFIVNVYIFLFSMVG